MRSGVEALCATRLIERRAWVEIQGSAGRTCHETAAVVNSSEDAVVRHCLEVRGFSSIATAPSR